MLVREVIANGTKRLKKGNSRSPGQEARWLFMHACRLSATQLISRSDSEVSVQDSERYDNLIDRRLTGEPFQYIVGEAEFRGIRLHVDPRVLIPRPETELLVDIVLSLAEDSGSRILDVGTGSGCIAIAIKKEKPTAQVVAVDCSQDALDVAEANARDAGCPIETRLIDFLLAADVESLGNFDIVVSNPPYIPQREMESLDDEVRRFEPGVALTPGSDELLFYRTLAESAESLLSPGGYLVVEIHSEYAERVVTLFAEADLVDREIVRDLSRKDRIVTARTAR
ncbi:MAG: peptide chain release factor N(5)-glutamine methyltransferase [Rhodothermales bacterium]|nr:peptide chain release factor N(5)-glutamine methyltransferase [Rhodothermales bacterium]